MVSGVFSSSAAGRRTGRQVSDKDLGPIAEAWEPCLPARSQSAAPPASAAFILAHHDHPHHHRGRPDVFLAIPPASAKHPRPWAPPNGRPSGRCCSPTDCSGILGAVILGLGRALGETMAVTMVIGNSIEGTLSLLGPGYTMSSIIANEFAEASPRLHCKALIEIGLILFFSPCCSTCWLVSWSGGLRGKTPQEARV